MVTIHPTALVDPQAELGVDVTVGPHAIVEAGAVIGDRCRLAAGVVVHGCVVLGADNFLDTGVALGGEAQHLRAGHPDTGVLVGQRNQLREYVTIHRATAEGGLTRVGDDNLFMVGCHLGHDTAVGSEVVIANATAVSGHCVIEDRANLSGLVGVHQFVTIGTMAMVGGLAGVNTDVPPYTIVEGSRAEVVGLNVIGLRRRALTAATRDGLKKAIRLLFHAGLSRPTAIETIEREIPGSPELEHLLNFMKAISAGRHGRQLEH
jgi:UDP-N-acetylglucosamine acyltransferase